MRTHVVGVGESPGSIAILYAECPKCSRDLCLLNADQKQLVTHPNGYITFESLIEGETLVLPEKWFEPRFELLPPAYFASLPYADGVTPSPFGSAAPGILRDFKALDAAADRLCALLAMDDQSFARNVADVAEAIGTAVEPAVGRSRYALAATDAIRTAAMHNRTFEPYLATGLPTDQARTGIQNALKSALNSACYAVGEIYGSVQPP